MKQLVSIIIPSYQGEAYISRSIDSALQQTYTNIEVLIIDDGSTDNTKSVVKSYIENDKIQYIYKANGGLSDARNVGVSHAQGEYIYFLDSDDWIENDYIEKMINSALKNNSDIVLSSIIMTDGKEETLRSDTFLNEIQDENVRNFYTPIHFHPIMQNKLFKASLIKDNAMLFPLGLYYEDVYFFVQAFEKASVVSRCPSAHFYYFQHQASIMKQTSKKLLDIERVFEQLMIDTPTLQQEKWFEYLCIRHLYLASTLRAIHAKDKQLLKLVVTSHKQFIENYFPNWKHNPFLKQRELYNSFGQYMYVRIVSMYGYKVGSSIAKYII
ncbi:MAG: glycosyltransferase family 2 protein [Culicoidibacterales bacterium]